MKAGTYWLIETKAPVGYNLDATPHEITIAPGSLTDAAATPFPVANKQFPSWILPITGGTGNLLFTLGGITLLGLAITIAIRRRKQQQQPVPTA